MADELVLDAARAAAGVAPVVDRLRIGLTRTMFRLGAGALAEHRLDRELLDLLGNLRNTAGEPVSRTALAAVFAYRPAGQVQAGVAALADRGYLEVRAELVTLTELGHRFVSAVHGFGEAAVAELWSGHAAYVTSTAPLVTRALEAARADAGPAFGVLAPRPSQQGSAPAVLAEQLTGLRFHRYDAHVAAWRAAGRTAEEMAALIGPERDAIEVETNRRAATPYAVLSPDERLALLTGLAALPG
jgi:hypothetical protein